MYLMTRLPALTGQVGNKVATSQRVAWVQRSRNCYVRSAPLKIIRDHGSVLGRPAVISWQPLRHVGFGTSCSSAGFSSTEAGTSDDVVELEINVEGMMCDGCSSRIETSLKAMSGVRRAVVSLENKLATVDVFALTPLDALAILPLLVTEIQGLGFEASPHIEYNPGSGQ